VLTRATEKPDAGLGRKDLRLRAVYRRELQNNIFMTALGAAAGIGISVLISCVAARGPAVYAFLAAPLVAASVLIAYLARRRGRRYIVALGWILGILPVVSMAVGTVMIPDLEAVALASVALIPVAFAVFVPFERPAHLSWLAAVNVMFAAMAVTMLHDGMDPFHPWAMVYAAIVGTVFSMGANEIQLRRRHQIDRQLLAVRGLYKRMKEHELDLRRQDEFLFMQQETLVVQQAELLRLNEELETIARLDALTGLGNRLRLNEDLAQIAARIERHGGTAGILLMDLDRFKRLNDSAGHLAGDAALRGVAEVLRKTSRTGDGVYRYGGEEFLVLLHDADDSVLRSAGQRYISAIEAAGMPHPDNPPYGVVTASAGATELSAVNCVDVDAALHDADEALYVAKDRGRNRVEIHGQTKKAGIVPIGKQREKQRAAS
jgi:diguanylate cyclase (GGDEF)-like protein